MSVLTAPSETQVLVEPAVATEKELRFKFGENWARFLTVLDEGRINLAVQSLKDMLQVETLEGKSFLDIGSGSGLFSLSAKRLGAKVFSFDYDPSSVACAQELRRRYFDGDQEWGVQQGSALDANYVRSLGKFDIVYSWGVLHHTGQMWDGLANAALPVADDGKLFISIYNDQGMKSKAWKVLKALYCKNTPGRLFVTATAGSFLVLQQAKSDLVRGKNPLSHYAEYRKQRGMSKWHDIVDWIGGYPFEVATPEEIFDFYRERSFNLTKLTTDGGGSGTNEFVFQKLPA